ncbi:MAG: DMT family transporter [Gemmatimonadales bacterium]|nr:DMT family transporter [Gemmatimonadales bacterium]
MGAPVVAALVTVQLLFASLAIVGRLVLQEMPAGLLALVRVGIASLFFVALNALRRGRWITDRGDLARVFLIGTLGITLNQSLFIFGLARTTAINATILVTTVPAFSVLGSVLLRREEPSALKFLGIALAATGAIWLVGPDRLSLAPDTALGNGLIVLAMACFAAYFLLSKPFVAKYDAITVTTYVMLSAVVGILPVAWLLGHGTRLDAVSPRTWALAGYLAVGPTIGSYLLNMWALRRASSNTVTVFIYLQPVFTILIAPLVLRGEELTGRALAGAALIFSGVGIVLLAERHRGRAALESVAVPGE